MGVRDAYGVGCRLLCACTSLASFTGVMELYTPNFVDPNGMLLCTTTPNVSFANFTVTTVKEGGTEIVSSWLEVGGTFFDTEWRHRPSEVGVLADVLGLDPYYAHSFTVQRYDDFRRDAQSYSLAGLVRDPIGNMSEIDTILQRVEGEEQLSEESMRLVLEELGQAGRPISDSNCALISGHWKKNTRYEVTVSLSSPNFTEALALWAAPVTYNWTDGPNSAVQYTVRGHKHGQMCPSQVIENTTEVNATVTGAECKECLACENPRGQVPSSDLQACVCFTSSTAACNQSVVGTSAAASRALAAETCTEFSEAYKLLVDPEQGETGLSDRLVSAEYLSLFVHRARPFMDPAIVFEGNATFWLRYSFDPRRPNDPTRNYGMHGTCQKCDSDGTFVDFKTGERVSPQDNRFEAMQTFKLIGYLLHETGFSCPELFDPDDTGRDMYGKWVDSVCGATEPVAEPP